MHLFWILWTNYSKLNYFILVFNHIFIFLIYFSWWILCLEMFIQDLLYYIKFKKILIAMVIQPSMFNNDCLQNIVIYLITDTYDQFWPLQHVMQWFYMTIVIEWVTIFFKIVKSLKFCNDLCYPLNYVWNYCNGLL